MAKTPAPSGMGRKWPFAVVGLVLATGAAFVFAYRLSPAPAEPLTDREARLNVLALCDAVQAYRDEHGNYQLAGPTPREVPRGGRAVPFPQDEAFHRLGFEPQDGVRFQYEVVLQESPVGEPEVSCLARGDFDADGLNSVYRVRLDSNGMTTPIEVEREGE
ncbi:hypothetical protein SAMN05443572_104529 [Myxococcus fulvus]|uniref:Uncharacterized protein n=1 Tax=Myxococcus fulvus TaxID=33 RepID=A0A511SY62_MYXFU|nr:hypothetical protein [Myxococcus fulvus]GEN06846.1 hypothetical protein MFU01_18830 [Myxococcus fulvus]SEU04147.1 hypothetical protein SAMN05443572_104529 [Myxococcus fulvus]